MNNERVKTHISQALVGDSSSEIFRPWGMRAPRNEAWFREVDNSGFAFSELLAAAQKEIKIVTGSLFPGFYEDDKIITTFNNLLKSKEASVEIVFSKGAGDIKEATEKLQEENPKLFKLAREYKDQLKLYWVKRRPIQHYAVFDKSHLFLEGRHASGELRETIIRVDDFRLGSVWGHRFDEYVKSKAESIPVD